MCFQCSSAQYVQLLNFKNSKMFDWLLPVRFCGWLKCTFRMWNVNRFLPKMTTDWDLHEKYHTTTNSENIFIRLFLSVWSVFLDYVMALNPLRNIQVILCREFTSFENLNQKRKLSFALWTTITCLSLKWRKVRRKKINIFHWRIHEHSKWLICWEQGEKQILTHDSSIVQMIICIFYSCHKTYLQLNICKIIQFWVSNTANELQNLAQVYSV